jgi:hypothetical protein
VLNSRRSLYACLCVTLLGVFPLGHQTSLPGQVRHWLDQEFPGWKFATVTFTLGPGTSPAWIAVDFNGDGRADYAVQFVAGPAGATVQRVIAFLRRGASYEAVPLDSFPANTGDYLRRLPAGTVRANLEAPSDSQGGGNFRLPHDGLEILYDEQGAKTCWYQAGTFHCVLTGD